MLGHHHFIEGEVVHGDGRGRGLGFPPANLKTRNELLPANGIYATMAVIDDVSHPAVTSIGVRPTVTDSGELTIETHILDGSYDLYQRQMRLAFVKWLRGEVKFDGLDPLKAQMARDCTDAAALFAQMAI